MTEYTNIITSHQQQDIALSLLSEQRAQFLSDSLNHLIVSF